MTKYSDSNSSEIEEFLNSWKDGVLDIGRAYQEGLDYFEVINPATSVPIGEAARGAKSDINDAVEAALNAFRHSNWKSRYAQVWVPVLLILVPWAASSFHVPSGSKQDGC